MGKLLQPLDLCPYIIVAGAEEAIDFYTRAFGATLDFKLTDPDDGRIGHAELTLGCSRIFLADEYPDFGAVAPHTIGGSPVKMHLEVEDADAFVAQAEAAGATVLRKVKLEFHGQRSGMLEDPFGHSWFVGSKAEDVSPEQMQEKMNNGAVD